MTKIRLGDMITDMSGSTGGTTYAKNKGGHYRKNKSMPINANTSYQQGVRAAFGAGSQAWRALSDVERAAWAAAAPSYPYLDRFGESRIPSGFQLYKTLNGNLDSVSAANISTPLPPSDVEVITFACSAFDDTTGPVVTVDPDPIPTGTCFLIEATAPYSAGITNVNSKFRIIKAWPASTTEAAIVAAIDTDYSAKFGSTVGMAGSKVTFRTSSVNTLTGQCSAYSYSEITITT